MIKLLLLLSLISVTSFAKIQKEDVKTGSYADFFMPIGMVFQWPVSGVPNANYLPCDGAAVSRTTYAALFAVLGITHGQGNGTTTFNVPDYRGRFIRGVDGTANRDPDKTTRTAMATGGNIGNNPGSIQTEDFKSHRHSTSALDNFSSVFGNTSGPSGIRGTYGGSSALTTLDALTQFIGGNETRPINAYVNYVIRAF